MTKNLMQTAAALLYVTGVLLFSAFARADVVYAEFTVPVHIEDVATNDQLQIYFSGNLPSPCYDDPSVVISQDTENPELLVIHLTSPIPTKLCMSRMKPYVTAVSLPQLARASALALDGQAVYTIKTEGYDFAMQVSGADLL